MPELPTNDYCMQIAMQRALECNVLCDHSSPWNAVKGSFGSTDQALMLSLVNSSDSPKELLVTRK